MHFLRSRKTAESTGVPLVRQPAVFLALMLAILSEKKKMEHRDLLFGKWIDVFVSLYERERVSLDYDSLFSEFKLKAYLCQRCVI